MATKKTRAKKQSSGLVRCVAGNTVQSTKYEYSREFGVGQIVDPEEEIAPGIKLGEQFRPGCFEEISAGSKVEPDETEISEDENGDPDRT